MKKYVRFCSVSILMLGILFMNLACEMEKQVNYFQGITIAPTYSYHLSGRTDRVRGYLVKIPQKNVLNNPGLIILASAINEGEGYAEVNGSRYDLPGLKGELKNSIDKNEKNAPGKEGWYSYSSGDDIIGKMIIPLNPDHLQDGLNEIIIYMNQGSDGFEIIDAGIESVAEKSPALTGQTYHLLARGKPSSIRDFDFVYNYKGEEKRFEKDIPDWARRGKVNFYRAGIDWDHLDRMFEMFKEAHVNLVATGIPLDKTSAEYKRVTEFIERCHEKGIYVTAFNSLGSINFSDYLMNPDLEKWISRDEYGALRWRGEEGGRYAADLQNEDYRKNDLLKRAETQIDAGVDELYYDWAIGGTGDVLKFFAEVRELAQKKGRNVTIYGNCKGNILADEVCDLTKSEGTTEAGVWDGKWVHNMAQARFYYASGDGVKPYRSKYEGADPGVANPGAYDVREGMKYGWKKPIAEASAFQSHFAIAEAGDKLRDGWVKQDNPLAMEIWNDICDYYAFLDAHSELYTDVTCISKIAVIAPPHIPSFEVTLTRQSLYNALSEMSVMYEVQLLHRMTAEKLTPYKAVIIPNIPWVEQDQLEMLKAYKSNGGKIYTIGSNMQLQELADIYSPANIFARLGDKSGRSELIRNLNNLTGANLIEIQGADYVAANIVQKRGTDQFILHFVNYNLPVKNVKVKVDLSGFIGKLDNTKIQLFSPDPGVNQPEVLSISKDKVEFILPELNIYAVVVLN